MGLLQSPDPAIKLARQYGIRGFFTPDLVPSIQPVVLIDDLTGNLSNEPVRNANAFISIGGVAAEFTVARLEVGPGTMVQVTSVAAYPESSGFLKFSFGSQVAAPAAVAAGQYSDGRLRSAGQTPKAILGIDTYAVAPVLEAGVLNSASSSFAPIPVNWIFGRTDAFDFLEIWVVTADKNLNIGLQWTEYEAATVK